MQRSRPKRQATKPPTESNKPDPAEVLRKQLFDTRTALDNAHVDLGRVYHLAHAAYDALSEPLGSTESEQRAHHRKTDAFVYSTWQAARDALVELAEAIEDLDVG